MYHATHFAWIGGNFIQLCQGCGASLSQKRPNPQTDTAGVIGKDRRIFKRLFLDRVTEIPDFDQNSGHVGALQHGQRGALQSAFDKGCLRQELFLDGFRQTGALGHMPVLNRMPGRVGGVAIGRRGSVTLRCFGEDALIVKDRQPFGIVKKTGAGVQADKKVGLFVVRGTGSFEDVEPVILRAGQGNTDIGVSFPGDQTGQCQGNIFFKCP